MFLRTVPPVVAAHSEWRSSKSFSLPLCFSDSASDSDFTSSSGTPIPHKVQMIIDSFRSTQSSDMSDQAQADASALDLARHAGHKVKPRCTETLVRSRRTASDCSRAGVAASEGSDSDDSVDRGIEEAIQEYLKEKVDHQQKAEPAVSPLQPPKAPQRREPDPPKQVTHSNSNKVLTASNHDQRGPKGVQPLATLKKKKKKPSKENPFRKMDPDKVPLSSGVRKASSSCSPGTDRTPPPLRIKEEEESLDSSSDDGIEEAIQRFQQEQKERHERSLHLREGLESSSDDGIEEAIRDYQQEKQKQEKCKLPSQSPLVTMQHSKVPILPGIQPLKTLSKKNTKKSAAADREVKCASPKPLAVSNTLNSQIARGDAVRDEDSVAEQQIHSTLTVNTTAELMCAEAILDISKTVMPVAFEPNLNLVESAEVETPPHFPSGLPLRSDEKSDESSVDSEDGIEQEIRKFLELKAKMHEQPPVAATAVAPITCSEASKTPQKKKLEDDQSKALRLSLSQKRKQKEADDRSTKRQCDGTFKEEPGTQSNISTDVAPHMCTLVVKHCKHKQNSPLHGRPEGSVPRGSSTSPNVPRLLLSQDRMYSSDKSSSLDSDEDLDAAIKDLLKTKKRVKKKVRDMKLKARKRLKLTQASDALKKNRPITDQKGVLAAKPTKSSKDPMSLMRLSQAKPHQSSKKPEASTHSAEIGAGGRTAVNHQHCILPEDSSSVDSDDSIEQEIRRFLAEKAKVSTGLMVKEEGAGGVDVAAGFADRELKSKDSPQGLQRSDPQLLEETSEAPVAAPRHADTPPATSEGPPLPDTGDGRTDRLLTRTLDEWGNGSLDSGANRMSFREGTSSDPFVVGLSTQCQVQHQNLFLMKPENYSMTDTPVNFRDLPSGLQSKSRIPLREVVRAVCPSPLAKAPLSSPSETTLVAKGDRLPLVSPESRTDSFYLHSRVKRPHWDQPSTLSPSAPETQPTNQTHNSRQVPPNPPHLSCAPLPPALSQPRITASVVRLRRDQAAVIPLSPHKTNHLQLRNRQAERERMDDSREKEGEEKCIDETDVESGEERRAEQQRIDKRQQRSSQGFFSTSIDPGELLSPYIALNTEERRQKFRHIRQGSRVMRPVKKRLQFLVGVSR